MVFYSLPAWFMPQRVGCEYWEGEQPRGREWDPPPPDIQSSPSSSLLVCEKVHLKLSLAE